MQKEEAQELTEKLDQEWKSIQALMVKKTPKAESADKPEEKPKVGFTPIRQQNVVPSLRAFTHLRRSLIFLCSVASSSWKSTT